MTKKIKHFIRQIYISLVLSVLFMVIYTLFKAIIYSDSKFIETIFQHITFVLNHPLRLFLAVFLLFLISLMILKRFFDKRSI